MVKETGIKCIFCQMYAGDLYMLVPQAMRVGVKKYE
jgi:hypothetical protein